MTRKQGRVRRTIRAGDLKDVLAEHRDLLKTIGEGTIQHAREAEMDQASPGETGWHALQSAAGAPGHGH